MNCINSLNRKGCEEMKKLAAILAFTLLLASLAQPIYAVEQSYTVLTAFEYDQVTCSEDDFVVARQGEAWGVDTLAGITIIPFVYANVKPIYRDYQQNGDVLAFYVARELVDGEWLYGLYSRMGTELLSCEYDEIVVEGSIAVFCSVQEQMTKEGAYNIELEKEIIPLGLWRITRGEDEAVLGKSVYHDEKGEYTECGYLPLNEPYMEFYDDDGKITFPHLPTSLRLGALYFGGGYFPIIDIETGKQGICTENSIVIPAEYDAIDKWGDVFAVWKDERWGVLDKNGQSLLDFDYDNYIPGIALSIEGESGSDFYTDAGAYITTADYSGGILGELYFFSRNSKYGAVYEDGTLAVPFAYSILSNSHKQGYALLFDDGVNEHGEYYCDDFMAIDAQGNIFIQPGRYARIDGGNPYQPILCYDEDENLVAIYSNAGQKLAAAPSLVNPYAGSVTTASAGDGSAIIQANAFEDIRLLSANISKMKTPRYAVMQNGKYAVVELMDYTAAQSSWVAGDINVARGMGIVPYELDISYQNACTREDFCIYLLNTLAKTMGKTLAEMASQFDALPMFADCTRYEVSIAAAMGIVSGTGNGRFSPDAFITREQAAVMLAHAAACLGIETNSTPVLFADSDQFSGYAVDAIAFVSSIERDGQRLMNGDTGRFNSKGLFTREQAVSTMLRLYK